MKLKNPKVKKAVSGAIIQLMIKNNNLAKHYRKAQ